MAGAPAPEHWYVVRAPAPERFLAGLPVCLDGPEEVFVMSVVGVGVTRDGSHGDDSGR